MSEVGALLEQLIMAPQPMRLDAAKRVRDGIAVLVTQVAELTRERDEARIRLSVSRGCRKVAKDEVTRLTEALAAAERRDLHQACVASAALVQRAEAAEARVRELEDLNRNLRQDVRDAAPEERLAREKAESECAALRAEYNRQVELSVGARNEAAALRAVAEAHVKDNVQLGEENERLRAEVERLRGTPVPLSEWQQQQASLAAANALLRDACPATHDGPRCQEWYRRRDAHLRAQPATAPARTETPEIRPGCTRPDYYEPDHPEDEYQRMSEEMQERDAARTEGEQAVLDIVCQYAVTSPVWMQQMCPTLYEAELARRGLK